MSQIMTNVSISQLLESKHDEILRDWLDNVWGKTGSGQEMGISQEEVHGEMKEILRVLASEVNDDACADLDRVEFPKSTALLIAISARRAELGFTPTDTAQFVLLLKESVVTYIEAEFDDSEVIKTEIDKINKIIDHLALVTVDAYVKARERVISQQNRSLHEMSTPVIRLWDKIVLLPLIGVLDTHRAASMAEKLLETVVDTESRVAILDVTGVPMIDTRVAQHLMKAVTAVQLLGAQAVITGISPDTAQTLVKLDINLDGFRTRSTLRTGLAEAFRLVGQRVTSN